MKYKIKRLENYNSNSETQKISILINAKKN